MKLKLFLISMIASSSVMASDLILRCEVKNIQDKTVPKIIIERAFGFYKDGVINALTTNQESLPFRLVVHPGFESEKDEDSGISKLAVSTKDGELIFSSNMAFRMPQAISTIVPVDNITYNLTCNIGKYQ
ncbi:MAG: hypothetical protein Q7U04_02270 [Bacteriovorax sp.]|nr:hypothetical protein [Bacteriovorax sp.]